MKFLNCKHVIRCDSNIRALGLESNSGDVLIVSVRTASGKEVTERLWVSEPYLQPVGSVA
jgi:hypothetical protein